MRTNIGAHVENRRLLEVAAGRHQLKEWEQKHLHECEICQGVFYVFINQSFTPREFETQTEKSTKAASGFLTAEIVVGYSALQKAGFEPRLLERRVCRYERTGRRGFIFIG